MSSAGLPGLSGTQAAPARQIPSTQIHASGALGASTATLVSRNVPAPSRPCAIRHDIRPASSYVQSSQRAYATAAGSMLQPRSKKSMTAMAQRLPRMGPRQRPLRRGGSRRRSPRGRSAHLAPAGTSLAAQLLGQLEDLTETAGSSGCPLDSRPPDGLTGCARPAWSRRAPRPDRLPQAAQGRASRSGALRRRRWRRALPPRRRRQARHRPSRRHAPRHAG